MEGFAFMAHLRLRNGGWNLSQPACLLNVTATKANASLGRFRKRKRAAFGASLGAVSRDCRLVVVVVVVAVCLVNTQL